MRPIIERGKVRLPTEACWLADFLNEAARFPHSKYSDQIDAMTQFLNWAQNKQDTNLVSKVTVIEFGTGHEVVYRDRYFERTGLGTFDNLFK